MQKNENEKPDAAPEKALPGKTDNHAEIKQRDPVHLRMTVTNMSWLKFDSAGTGSAKTDLIAQAQVQKDDPLTKLKNKFEHPGRNNPDSGIDYAAAQDGYNRFALQKYGVDRALVPAIIRNEQYWLGPKDGIQEWVIADRPFQMRSNAFPE